MSFGTYWRGRRGGSDPNPRRGALVLPSVVDLVEVATGEGMIGPDWAVNLEICDFLNSRQWQTRDVINAVMKRLQHKSSGVQILALTLLETMIKNCGENVHRQVAESDILFEMIKIAKKKSDAAVRDKILLLLDSWQEAFGGSRGKYPSYYLAYAELKNYGVKFPQRSGDAVPIFTPPSKHPERNMQHPAKHHDLSRRRSRKLHEAMATEMGNLSLSDLISIRRVMELLSDMLQAINQNNSEAVKDEVIVDLVYQCRANQKKIIDMVSSTRDEELLNLGLSLNDKLRNIIAKHDAIAYGFPSATESPKSPTKESASSTSHADSSKPNEEVDEDDGFTQLARRNSKIDQVPFLRSTQMIGQNNSPSCHDAVHSSPVTTTMMNQDWTSQLDVSVPTDGSPCLATLTAPQFFNDVGSQLPIYHNTEAYEGYPNSQLNSLNQGYTHYNGYVVPWARQFSQTVLHPQSQPPLDSSSYPPPPWEIDSPPSKTNQPGIAAILPPWTMQQQNDPFGPCGSSFSASRPLQRFHSFGSTSDNSFSSKSLQQQHSLGSRESNSFFSEPFQHLSIFQSIGNDSEKEISKTQAISSPRQVVTPKLNQSFEDSRDPRDAGKTDEPSEATSPLSDVPGKHMVGKRE